MAPCASTPKWYLAPLKSYTEISSKSSKSIKSRKKSPKKDQKERFSKDPKENSKLVSMLHENTNQ